MRVAPARNGWKWLTEGLRYFRASPAWWTLLVLAYWMLIALVNRIDYIGSLIVAICLPAFSLSFMIICEEIRNKRALHIRLLFSGFMRNTRTLLQLGVIYLVAIGLVLAVSALADGGTLMDWILFNRPPEESVIREGKMSGSLMIAALLATPVIMSFWFAPLLAGSMGMGAAKSLFYSYFACWRNWRALCVYGAAVTLFAMLIAVFVAIFAVASGGNANAARGLMMAATIVMMPTLFGSFYAAYIDIFPHDDEPEATPESTPIE